jgi:AcrR family transcriptional regulator
MLHAYPAQRLKKSLEKLVAELIATGRFETMADPSSPRARIAQAALELFAEGSYEGTTTKAIAKRARTTERTLYKHYESKEKLFARTVFPAFLKALMPILVDPHAAVLQTSTGDFRTKLRALIVNRISFAVKNPRLFTMMWRELLERPAFRAAYQKLLAQRGTTFVDAFIAEGKQSGYLRDLPQDVILRTIVGQLIGYAVTRLVLAPEKAWDTERDADQLLELILQGIGSAR